MMNLKAGVEPVRDNALARIVLLCADKCMALWILLQTREENAIRRLLIGDNCHQPTRIRNVLSQKL